MDVRAFIREITSRRDYQAQVVHVRAIEPREARYDEPACAIAEGLRSLLRRQNIHRLYVHQARSVDLASAGRDFVVVTGTASGKTLCYNLPVVQALLADPQARAMYLFPTKALTQDQFGTLQRWAGEEELINVLRPAVYDGDTPAHNRTSVRARASIVLTNPDMLHVGILPYHGKWHEFLRRLKFLVIDELHTYRGIFGSHVAGVLRRLLRLCDHYGSRPQIIASSATIANPLDLAARLTGRRMDLVDDDGSPRGRKYFVLWNPPFVGDDNVSRRSANVEAVELLAELVKRRTQTIVFAKSRVAAELIYKYARRRLEGEGDLASRIRPYRGGYLPSERRQIEQELFSGRLLAVSATNALELGIDVGGMDAAILVGFPGTICSTWQQAGRAGRRAGLSAAVLVASALPLSQYLVTHPRYFFGQPVEQALLDPDNLAVLANHLACAAFELPFEREEPFGNFSDAQAVLDALAEEGLLHSSNGRYTWIGEGYPASGVSLRASTSDNVVIQDVADEYTPTSPQVIGQMDRPSAPMLIHEGAIYLHGGATYVVESLDWEKGLACVRAAQVDYYTSASATTDVRNLQVLRSDAPHSSFTHIPEVVDEERVNEEKQGVHRAYGELLVTTRATGYRKIKRYTHEVLAWEPIDLPEQQLRTFGYWLALSEELTARLQEIGVLMPPADYGPNWPAQRDAALARDGHRCRHCGAYEREGRQHDVHHITPFRSFGYLPGANDLFKFANVLENLITLCPNCHHRVERTRGAHGALSGLAYLLGNLAPLHLMCDPGDLGSTVQARAPETGLPTVTLYDRAPGGAGLSVRLYELHDSLLEAALDVVRRCPCADGCPGCVGPAGEGAGPGAKALTQRLLEAIVGTETRSGPASAAARR